MKKVLLVLLLFGTSCLFGLGMSVTENGFVFLGNVAPGGSEYGAGFDYGKNTIVSLNANPAGTFSLDIQADGFRGPASLSLTTLSWQLCYAHAGTTSAPWIRTLTAAYRTQAFNDTGIADRVFTYTPVAGDSGLFQFNFLWHIAMPAGQTAGNYFASVRLTLTQ